MRATARIATCIGVLLLASAGCQQVMPPPDVDLLVADTNDNGFPDVAPPDGVAFVEEQNIKVRVRNTLTFDDLKPIIDNSGIDPALVGDDLFSAEVTLTLGYGEQGSSVISDTITLEPFEKAFEVACPETVEANVAILVSLPLVGPTTVAEFPYDLSQDAPPVTCGQTVEVETFLNDQGNPDQTTTIS